MKGPKVLFLDIETAPILGYFWRMFSEITSIDQIEEDWHVLSWSAKWQHEDKIMYMDQRNAKDMEDDSKILKSMWELLDEADIVVTHNGVKFDIPKLNARFIINGMKPPTKFKNIDTCQKARQIFGFTSNKLEYIANALKAEYRKLKHKKFPGIELWRECLRRNKEAWKEMEKYNKNDVLTLEAVYDKIVPWDNSINFSLYYDDETIICPCGSEKFIKRGFHYTNVGKFQRYKCLKCGAETRSRSNLFSKEKKASLRVKT